MRSELDRRVIPEVVIDLVRTVQAHEPAHLAGGIALSGAHLSHGSAQTWTCPFTTARPTGARAAT